MDRIAVTDRSSLKSRSQQPQNNKPFTDSYDLPPHYNSTSLTIMPRDPNWIYAYWEIAHSSLERARQELRSEFGGSSYVIRMYDTTYKEFDGSNANHTFDIEVGPHTNNWYINLWSDNVTYCADLGMRSPSGRFVQFARSNFAFIPRATMSDRKDLIWMEQKDGGAKAQFFLADEGTNPSNKKEPIGRNAMQESSPEDVSDEVRARRLKRIYLTEDDVRAYYYGLSPTLRDLLTGRLRRLGYLDKDILRLLRGRLSLNDLLMRNMTGKEFVKRISAGASQEMPEAGPGGASESLVSGASEKLYESKGRKFFFELGTELIVYGRTEPDASVWLGDKKIELGNDGSFTLRLSLADAAKIPLAFKAASKDGLETREIVTQVERVKTRYNP